MEHLSTTPQEQSSASSLNNASSRSSDEIHEADVGHHASEGRSNKWSAEVLNMRSPGGRFDLAESFSPISDECVLTVLWLVASNSMLVVQVDQPLVQGNSRNREVGAHHH